MCSNSGAMGVRRVWSHTENEPPHETEMALGRTSDLGMGRCVCFLDDVHGPLEHERPPSSSLQGPCALILGQPPRCSLGTGARGDPHSYRAGAGTPGQRDPGRTGGTFAPGAPGASAGTPDG